MKREAVEKRTSRPDERGENRMTGNHICLSGRFSAADDRAGGSRFCGMDHGLLSVGKAEKQVNGEACAGDRTE